MKLLIPRGKTKFLTPKSSSNYRKGYNLFACNGILFNHESPRRGETFVTRKITRAIANIIAGKQKRLYIETFLIWMIFNKHRFSYRNTYPNFIAQD